ncbi:oxidoreductase [Endozoicomonas sp. Mp262]|uniref:oxidoreductase n=1 Tax=Endozoicomonas sp. Mp262 TaxID=2919499 RepID=UPI0021D90242
MIKVGVIGFGFSATIFHLPLIEASDYFELVAISSSQTERVMSEYPDVEVFATPDKLISAPSVELVVITAPNDVHFPLARSCLEQGKHVVLEKPMATTAKEADTLVRLANHKNRMLSVFHNRRWDGDFLTVKKLIDNNQLGDIRFFESHFDRFRPEVRDRWKESPVPGGGVWFDLGAHLIDQALVLFGVPQSVTGRCLSLRDKSKATDYFHVMLHYQNKEVVLHSSPYSAGANCRFQVQGSKGSFVKYGLDPQENQLKGGISPKAPDFGLEEEESFGVLYHGTHWESVETEGGCYLSYYEGIASAIEKGEIVPVTGDQASLVIKILEVAERSSREGKTLAVSSLL